MDSWDDLAKELSGITSLDDLVLVYHGFAGGILVGDEGYGLDDGKLKDVFAKAKTKITNIRFEGCHIGEAPDAMAAFGRLFSAKEVSGFTWASYTNTLTITLGKGQNAKGIETALAPYGQWVFPEIPVNQLAISLTSKVKHKASYETLFLMWFHYSLEAKAPYENDNYKRLGGSVKYKVRSQAKKTAVAAAQATRSESPAPAFEYVTVTL